MIDELGSILGRQYWGNTLGVYLEALAIVVGVIVALWIFRTVVVKRIHRLVQKTQTDIDDFLIELLDRLGPLTYFLIGLYLASQSLVLSPGISRIGPRSGRSSCSAKWPRSVSCWPGLWPSCRVDWSRCWLFFS